MEIQAAAGIHPSAIISPGARIGEGTSVGPYSVIGPGVVLGTRNVIGPHVVLDGHTRIGDGNHIFQFASIGAAPQDLKYKGEPSVLEIGDANTIREYVTVNPGTSGGGMLTKIGNSNLFMAGSHVGHDALVGDGNVFANCAALAGHVVVGNRVIIGGFVGIHQFVGIGDFAFLGAGSMITKDIPPYCIAQGDRAGIVGINKIGLERAGFPSEEIRHLKWVYKELFLASGKFSYKIETLLQTAPSSGLSATFLRFIATSKRGVTHPRKGLKEESDGD